jgi:hypothetical protein
VLLTLFVVPAVYSLVARKTKSPHYMSDLVDKLMAKKTSPTEESEPTPVIK